MTLPAMTLRPAVQCKPAVRTPRPLSFFVAGVLAVAATASLKPADAADPLATSIAEFVAAKDRWDRLVGRPMRLEGRYTVMSPTDLRFLNCEMSFVFAKSFRRSAVTTKNLEVSGQIERKGDGLQFLVTELKPRETDAEQLKLRRALLDNMQPDAFYQLGHWARQRGAFYDDRELTAAGDRLYLEGVTVAYERLAANDIAGLRELAGRATQFSLAEGVRLGLLHDANRREWAAAKKAVPRDDARVLGLIERDLPGALTPLPPDQLRIREDYEAAPLAVYRVADADARRLLDRAFYLEVALAHILLDADKDGRNGYQIAERIDSRLPELAALADTFRQQELKYLLARLSRLTRTQMVDLSERFRKRGDETQATAVLRDWLQAQEPRAKASGPTELMELGDEYINLLRDEPSAARMYQAAYQQNPQLATAAEWLTTHGFDLTPPVAASPSGAAVAEMNASVDEAIRAGRLQIGMTGAQVRQSLGTRPSAVIRIAAAGVVSELWVFEDYGLTVRLHRRSTSPSAQVVAIDTID